MRILGIAGGMDFPHEDFFKPTLTSGAMVHDSAAVLIEDGKVVAAFEEERLNRIKHTGKFPVHAIQSCLDTQGIQLGDIDKIVYYSAEPQAKFETITYRNQYRDLTFRDPKAWLAERLQQYFNLSYSKEDIVYVNHHYCHAASAYYMSGFDQSLVVTIDGASPEGDAGIIFDANKDAMKPIHHISNNDSLGGFYNTVIGLLGYSTHDEYKVMGLAPYGDPSVFRRLFKKAYTLLPDGKFRLNTGWYFVLIDALNPRLKGEEFTQEHKDVAAALQETLEQVVMHMLTHFQKSTGHTRLCLAGGVAHNCSLNGKILYSGLFDEVFVQPASHDAGNALGGALLLSRKLNADIGTEKLRHLYWGTDIPASDTLDKVLKKWDKFITFKKADNIVELTARLLAEGSVIGWVQGRSEFGPRALGNRSILADPRPAENKKIINEMVKKREGYRPFAPSILEEYVSDYYEMPSTKAPYSYMNFVLATKQDKQSSLGAVTHVDGTARIQTVSRDVNERYWSLINEFRKLTGVPILLNTSFNNNAEPIVDSEEDAIVSFLTTNIHALVIGDYLIEKKTISKDNYLELIPGRLAQAELKKSIGSGADGKRKTNHYIRLHFEEKYKSTISEDVFHILERAEEEKTLEEWIEQFEHTDLAAQEIIDACIDLWSKRLITLRPSYAL
ncbi:carbamoyltransferase [Paenibacillus cellulosilyticus]|uniref:Carbamoyltransferase n=1 Tax=Paenibacillus cellulosilyticus TaxID=375489 RepID=A0A2V2YYI8_9BACL|nr:carbamoyltransferase C-terminal domain-containing protein [Paenibacillus cellulosilyticus]PWW07333.1 carbamoyltransferase [Paenibacillus cellulosilyticus]QKS44488.1 nodulation protein [Paenibacillus cellulosilyticus]